MCVTSYLVDLVIDNTIASFYAEWWSSHPNKMLPYMEDPASLIFLANVFLAVCNFRNKQAEIILRYLKRHDFEDKIRNISHMMKEGIS